MDTFLYIVTASTGWGNARLIEIGNAGDARAPQIAPMPMVDMEVLKYEL